MIADDDATTTSTATPAARTGQRLRASIERLDVVVVEFERVIARLDRFLELAQLQMARRNVQVTRHFDGIGCGPILFVPGVARNVVQASTEEYFF